MSFQFKQFKVEQKVNAHKVGTDSMVLGAWIRNQAFKNILDIGTGTGILALMQAQNHPNATITAIEPNSDSFDEAYSNFKNSQFSNRITAKLIRLQDFEPSQKFDLIICNPPYFVNATLSDNQAKNSARHTVDLSIHELYQHAARLLEPHGQFSIVFPSDILNRHLKSAKEFGLYPLSILEIETEIGKAIRHIISFSFTKSTLNKSRMIAKYSSGIYSKAYVELTADFHNRKLPFQ